MWSDRLLGDGDRGPALLRRAGSAEKGYQPQAITRLLREAAWGDPVALPAVEEVGRWLGAGLGGLVNAFNPQRVGLGGYLATMWPLVDQIVQAELRGRVMAPALEALEIKPAQLGTEATLLGAAELALTQLLDEPTLVPPRAADTRSA